MGVGERMPPEETGLVVFSEPKDIGMYFQYLVVKNGLPNVLFSMDEKIDSILQQKPVGKNQL